MLPYPFLRPLLFALPAELAHRAAIRALQYGLVPPQPVTIYPSLKQTIWDLDFDNPVGLAAGFDKNAEALKGLSRQGFGFIEAGTVTPRPQKGNPKPRLFRLIEDEAVINRMGMPGYGLAEFTENFTRYRAWETRISEQGTRPIVGANIGKNKDTQNDLEDYVDCLNGVYEYADYVTLNISSPNTPGLRDLQHKHALENLLCVLLSRRQELEKLHQFRVPLLLKLAPDLLPNERTDIAEVALKLNIDGLMLTNTTISRPSTLKSLLGGQTGGLSGKPLMPLSTEILRDFYKLTQGKIPLIGVGGIASAEDAYAKIRAGASLVQLYSAFVYQGFGLVKQIVDGLDSLLRRDGFSHISEAIGIDHK